MAGIIALASLGFGAQALAQSGFETKAPHAVILDAKTGEVLFEKDAQAPMKPASMTKIMTVNMIFEALQAGRLSEDTKFKVSEDAWRRGGQPSGSSTMFLDVGSSVSIQDLLKGIIIQSGNDASITVAEGMAGSEEAFAAQMTRRAHAMGLRSATFRNATGWPHPEHEISALDLAKLAQYQIQNFPQYYPLYAEREFTWNKIKQHNRNPLLGRINGADGLKTGHTQSSGYGLVGSAKRGDDRRIIVINGLDSKSARTEVGRRLMDAAFQLFQVYDLYDADKVLAQAKVFMGKSETVGMVLAKDVKYGLYVPDRPELRTRIEYRTVSAPVQKGDIIGTLIISAPKQAERRYDLHASQDVARKGLFGRIWRSLLDKIGGQ